MSEASDHDLCSAAATFTPRHAFLNLLPLHMDPRAINALHEMAHAETFAGSAFFASFAARILKGEAVPIRPLRGFLEAIPDAYRHVGGRSAPGSGPDDAVVCHLVTIANRYVAEFGDFWRALGFDLRTATSPAAAIGRVNASQLVGRTLIQTVARSALELALVRAGEKSPEDHVRALYEQFEMRQPLPLPGPGEAIQDHIHRLMRRAPRKFVGMFDDQVLLLDVLLNADQTTLLELRPLLSAVVGLEYFTLWCPPRFETLFFFHPTADFGFRLERYVAARARSPSHKQALSLRLGALAAAIAPVRDRKLILVDPDHVEDPRVHTAYELLSLKSYIFALPHFCEHHLRDASMIGSSQSYAITALKQTSEEAFEAYLGLIARQAKYPELSTLLESVVLRQGKSSDGRDILLLRV